MKNVITLIMVLLLCLSLYSCGSSDSNKKEEISTPDISDQSPAPSAEEEGEVSAGEEVTIDQSASTTWFSDMSVDDFGDITEDSTKILKSLIFGDFSNTATQSSELGGCIFIMPNSTGLHFTVAFRLMEYGDNPVSYLESDANNITLKIKIEDEIQEYSLYGIAPTGDLYLGLDEETDCDYFVDALYLGYDIHCIITIGSSQYNFDVSGDDFTKVFQDTYDIHSSKDALEVFMAETYRRAGTMYLLYSSYDLIPVESTELPELLPGYWKSKELETNSYSYFYEYTENGTIKTIGKFISDELIYEDGNEWQYHLEDYVVCRSDGAMFQYIKIIDGYYLVIYRASWGVEYSYIYIECQEDGTPVYPLS